MEVPSKLLAVFQSKLSKDVTILKYSSVLYFGLSIPLVFSTFFWFRPRTEGNISEVFCFAFLLVVSISVAILATLWRMHYQQNKIKGLNVNFWSWDRDSFRSWQKEKIKEEMKLRDEPKDVIEKAYESYINHVKYRKKGLVPFVKPALIISFILPLYTITIKTVLESAGSVNVYMLYLALIGLLLALTLMTYHFLKDVFSLFDSKKAMYEEFLSILEELKFEHVTS